MPCSLLLPKRPPILRRGRGDQRGPLVVSQLRGVPGVQARRLVYETRRSGLLVINVTSELEVTDGAWHELIIKQTPAILQLYLDTVKLDQDLETASTHDLLDPYIEQLQFGGKHSSSAPGKYLI